MPSYIIKIAIAIIFSLSISYLLDKTRLIWRQKLLFSDRFTFININGIDKKQTFKMFSATQVLFERAFNNHADIFFFKLMFILILNALY